MANPKDTTFDDSSAGSVENDDTIIPSNKSVSSTDEEDFAGEETKRVSWLRAGVVSALLLAAVSVCLVVYFLLAKSEEDTFVAAFGGEVEKVFSETE